jgi:hypothetical protein
MAIDRENADTACDPQRDQASGDLPVSTQEGDSESNVDNKGRLTPIFDIQNVTPIDPDLFPDRRYKSKGNSSPPTTIANIQFMLKHYGIEALYDVIKKDIIVNVPGQSNTPEMASMSSLAAVSSLSILNDMIPAHAQEFLPTIAAMNPVNAPSSWIRSRDWDGKDRLTLLFQTLVVPDDYPQQLRDKLVYHWLLSCVACACLAEGFRSRGVLVLQGRQGLGKTTWIMELCDDKQIRANYIKTGHHLDPSNKDSLIIGIAHWIVELGELDSTFRKDIARLKGFLTDAVDKVRIPYAKRESEFPRRTVFCASVNEETYLVDTTGNTRFWTIPVIHIDFNHGIDMQQVFAQLYCDLLAGKQWWLSTEIESQLERYNAQFRSVSAIRERLINALDFSLPQDQWSKLTATEILSKLGIENPSNMQFKELNSSLKELEDQIGPSTKSQGKVRWTVPLPTTQFMGY